MTIPSRKTALRHILLDISIIIASLYASLYLRVGTEEYAYHLPVLQTYLPFVVVIRLASLAAFGSYHVLWRYVSTVDAVRLMKAVAISSFVIIAITFFFPEEYSRLPRSVYLIDALLVAAGLMGIRLFRRVQYEGRHTKLIREGKRTLIYGAGNNGRLLAHRFKSDLALNTHLVGFIDDDPLKKNMILNGVPVLGTREELASLIEKYEVSQLIIALPHLAGEILREVVLITRRYNIRPRITANLQETTEGPKKVDIYREIELPDLLNRPPRDMDLASIRELVRGKKVLVTGAGGSIGSEIARQVMAHEPSRLLLLENSEYNLYEIDKELRLATHDTQRVVPLMIDLKNEETMKMAMLEYSPDVVFHAAAYKHVHLVESNPYPSILNNIGGTQILLNLCREVGVQTFVMISTDKAVNPAGIMGGTKRVCELMVTSMALETGKRYCSVRFGNVLGSSGSLIPLLKSQINEGGPVTITHKDMTRFFMLIPEAVSLVLKASTIARPGDINVLRMGEPVRILDIARNLIALMGKTEDEVPIVYTGLRPGEKMFEELYIRGDELKTEHPDILTLTNGDSNMATQPEERRRIAGHVARMLDFARKGNKEALYELNELVKSNYVTPANQETDSSVTPFAPRSTRNH